MFTYETRPVELGQVVYVYKQRNETAETKPPKRAKRAKRAT